VLPSRVPGQRPFPGLARRPAGPAPAISATDRLVYVLMGNTLYALDAKTLKEVAKTTLEPVPPAAEPRGFGLRERPLPQDAPRAPEALPRRPRRDGNVLPPLPPAPEPPVAPRTDAPLTVRPEGPRAPVEPFGGFRPFRPGAPMPFVTPGFAPMVPTISATDHYVYVLRGNRLYAFDAKTLKEVAKTTLGAPPESSRSSDR
jgi:hypothetical protein